VVGNLIPNLTRGPFFYHNSCISSLNEQCKGTLSIYIFKKFQWYHGGPIWCLFDFSTKALNIRDSCTSVNALRNHWVEFLHSPPFVRMCFTPKHNILALWDFTLYTVSCEPNVKVATTWLMIKFSILISLNWAIEKFCQLLIPIINNHFLQYAWIVFGNCPKGFSHLINNG
jgi:hypothetical protein